MHPCAQCTHVLMFPRSSLLALHCTAHLRHDVMGQEMLLNLLLRNYLHYHLYDQVRGLHAYSQS